jgi:hypothetical protein
LTLLHAASGHFHEGLARRLLFGKRHKIFLARAARAAYIKARGPSHDRLTAELQG